MDLDEVLEPVGGVDAGALLGFLGAHAVPGVEHWDGVTYSRSLGVGNDAAVLRLTAAERGAVRLRARSTSAATSAEVVRRARHLLALDDDSSPAEATLGADPLIGPLVRARPGLRVPGSVDHAETLVRTVIGQQVSLAGARTVTARVVAAAGRSLPVDLGDLAPGVTTSFPTVHALAGLDPAALPMPRSRGRCVVAAAAALAEQPSLVGDDDALLRLPGVGPWTVAYTRLRTRRDPDVFLPTDLAVRRELARLGACADPAEVARLSGRWAPYRSTALLHLWTAYLSARIAA